MKLLLTLLLFTFNCFAQFGFNTINSSTYLTERYLDNVNGVYGWQKFDASYQNTNVITPWIGNNNLTVYSPSGNLNATTDHLGRMNALSLNGTDQCLYDASSDHDNANESFTMWTWIQTTDNSASYKRVFSKYSTNKNYQSFTANLYEDTLTFDVWTDNLGNSNNTGFVELNNIVDGKYHFYAVSYNNNENSILQFYDGTATYYLIADELNERNNGISKLSFGCQIDSDLSATSFLNANIAGMGFTHHAMTTNELRKIYLAGARRYGYIDGNDVVQIPGVKKGYEIGDVQYELTVTGTNWTTVGAVGVPYKIGEVWRLKFNIVGQVSSAVSELELTIDGILIKGGSGRYQALACWEWNSTVELTQRCTASSGTNKIKINLDSTGIYFTFAGDIELDQKPSFITELD